MTNRRSEHAGTGATLALALALSMIVPALGCGANGGGDTTGGTGGTGGGTGGTGTGGTGTGGTGTGGTGTGGTGMGGRGGTGTGGTGTGGTGTGGTGTGGTGPGSGSLKIGFTGDTSNAKPGHLGNLALILSEKADAYVVAGDMTYSSDNAGWWTVVEGKLGADFPVFVTKGNHDTASWGIRQASHTGGAKTQGTVGQNPAMYEFAKNGITVAIGVFDKGQEAALTSMFANVETPYRICVWHYNRANLNVGGKGDDMSVAILEACRMAGGIVISAHGHSAERTKTLTQYAPTPTIDTMCANNGPEMCVGPGRGYVGVYGAGGEGLRGQSKCMPTIPASPWTSTACPYWHFINTTNQGANFGTRFIEFGPNKTGKAYYKYTNGATHDPYTIKWD